VIGIGAFGSRVALRLLWSGYHTLQIYDIADVATRLFTNDYGGMATGSPKMMAQACDAIIAVLPSAAELREVCFGWEGLADGFAEHGVLIDLGNTDPLETESIAADLAAAGVDLVAAPAFGTPAEAKEGKLTLVVGGPQAAVERCRPLLGTIATTILHADAAAGAQAASAIADYLRAARLLAASEAIRLGRRFGLEAATVLDVARQLGGGDIDDLLRREVVPRRFDSGVQLGLVRRNVDLVARLAAATDTRSPLIDATLAAWTGAERMLGYGADHTAIIKWLEKLPGLKPEPEAKAATTAEIAAQTDAGERLA
ncbi:MAG: NAD(P)-dependent oxidoreductase, partial [Bradyrhizobiaceae bacterium]|nr:NAD(P)-dependent oxidoreductase [Bradyrhizobiaceae bacterium]